MLAGPANFAEPKYCTIGADSSRFHRRSLGRHHFGSYVFKPQVLLQEVGAEPLNVAATLHVTMELRLHFIHCYGDLEL